MNVIYPYYQIYVPKLQKIPDDNGKWTRENMDIAVMKMLPSLSKWTFHVAATADYYPYDTKVGEQHFAFWISMTLLLFW